MLPEVDRCMRRFSARSTFVETVTLSSSDCSKPRQVSLIVFASFAVLRKESRILVLSFRSGRTNTGHARASVAREPQGSWPKSVRVMEEALGNIEPQMRSCHNKHERQRATKCRRLLRPMAQPAPSPSRHGLFAVLAGDVKDDLSLCPMALLLLDRLPRVFHGECT